jgi:hypothetical protein
MPKPNVKAAQIDNPRELRDWSSVGAQIVG